MVKILAIAHYLFAASLSGYYSKEDWQNWADILILKEEKPEEWVFAVSLASDLDALSKALSEQLITESHTIRNTSLFSDAVIGFLYLKFLSKQISMRELLLMSGDEADGGEGSSVSCEEFYMILNELENKKSLEKDRIFIKKISHLYESFENIARNQIEVLKNY
ncbi:hypothetical protein [Paenibacillus kribbensis]|uniref:hypothetical protein n=1 Tax=Paenibacillus kribbensis TaxID=172713 RepID=UPI0008398008|nr:hypothetical protein [Paenibacillus kribbensis]